jgi:hypothetical protein
MSNDVLTNGDELLGLPDLAEPSRHHIKAWGRAVMLKSPTGADLDEWMIYSRNNQGLNVPWRAKLAQLMLCDEKNERLYKDSDVQKLHKKSAAALEEISVLAMKKLAVTPEEIEDLEKN